MNRYELEHRALPMQFYDNCAGMIHEIEEKGADYFVSCYEEVGTFPQDAFSVGLLDYEGGVNIIRAFVAEPEAPTECACQYYIYSKEQEPMCYLTVEQAPEGGYALLAWDASLNYRAYGEFNGANERTVIDTIVTELLSDGDAMDSGRFGEMVMLLKEAEIPYVDDEIADYMQMFDVIGEMTEEKLTVPEMVKTFAALSPVMKDENLINSRQQMKTMYDRLEELPETAGKLDNKERLFFAFSVYIANNIISENDDKKHYYMGLPEFESADYVKYKMEEYWGFEPYMFSFAVNK